MDTKQMSKEALDWQAEEDVRILESYQDILNDKKRKAKALKAAQNKASDLQKRAEALSTQSEKLKK